MGFEIMPVAGWQPAALARVNANFTRQSDNPVRNISISARMMRISGEPVATAAGFFSLDVADGDGPSAMKAGELAVAYRLESLVEFQHV
jgi:hypothetical protein